jgi:hypothetical protein
MLSLCSVLSGAEDFEDMASIHQVMMVEASSEKKGVVQSQTRLYLSSLVADATIANKLVRNY